MLNRYSGDNDLPFNKSLGHHQMYRGPPSEVTVPNTRIASAVSSSELEGDGTGWNPLTYSLDYIKQNMADMTGYSKTNRQYRISYA